MALSAQDALSGVFQDDSDEHNSSSEEESDSSDGIVSDMSIEDRSSDNSDSDSSVPSSPPRPATLVQPSALAQQAQPAAPAQPAVRRRTRAQPAAPAQQAQPAALSQPAARRRARAHPADPAQPQPAGRLVAPNGSVWTDQVPLRGRAQAANIMNVRSGPRNVDRDSSKLQLLELFLPVEMLQLILDHTNAFALTKRGRQWQNIAMMELRSTIGLLLFLGLTKSGHERAQSFWSPGPFARPLCQSTMSGTRFMDILTMLRFDDMETHAQRMLADKFAPIREVFESFAASCRQYFSPGDCLTVDEQLVAFRGRCSFRQYMPTKPAKYGLKFWACVDSDSHYLCNIQPYIGKEDGRREFELGARVVKDMVQPYYGTGRNVTCDNFFTSAALADHLLTQRITIVGTIKGHRREVPKEMRKENVKGRDVKSSRFVFNDNKTLVSFVPKKNRSVTLLSTMHHDTATNPITQKPEIIDYYNSTKAGVDTVDQLCSLYNCARKTKRWTLVVFFNLVNLAGINAYVLWLQLNPGWHQGESSRRHAFLSDVIMSLVEPQIRTRVARPMGMRRATTSAMSYLGYEVHFPRQQPAADNNIPPYGACHMCHRQPDATRRRRTSRICCLCNRFSCTEHSQSRRIHEVTCMHCIMAV